MKALELNGAGLTLEQVGEVARSGRPVKLATRALPRLQASRRVVEAALQKGAPAYGINTGLGRLSDVRIEPDRIRELQVNLVRSHACGLGPALAPEVVRAMLLLRANSLAKGFSGVRPQVIEMLCGMLNRGVHPIVPSQGSVGASGDLAPLAHMTLVLIGEGEAEIGGRRMPGAQALRTAGLRALRLEAKEGLSLLNGTQAMLACGILAWLDAKRLVDAADVVGALTLEALRGTPVAFDARLQEVRGHRGQTVTAARLRRLIAGSAIRRSHLHCGRVQDAYSLRCMPQVHGAVRDTLEFTAASFGAEANAAVDNPLVFASGGRGEGDVLSGGNFHGEPLAFALDYLAIVLSALAGISERRTERLVNPALNEGLPAFLAPHPGLESGLMMAQVSAAALVAENRVLAHPASVDSLTTSGNKEDYVSMGMGAALKLQRVLTNTAGVLGIELMSASHALVHLQPLQPSPRLQRVLQRVRTRIPPLTADRVPAGDMAAAAEMLLSGEILAAAG